jgi:hypothetical protein
MNAPAPRRFAFAAITPTKMSANVATILPVIERLSQMLDAENEQIASRQAVDYVTLNARKSQALLEINRLAPTLRAAEASPEFRAAMTGLRAELERNARLLKIQLQAARTITDIIARAIRDGQSDGTYSAYSWRDDD